MLKFTHERLGNVDLRVMVNTSKMLAVHNFCVEKDNEICCETSVMDKQISKKPLTENASIIFKSMSNLRKTRDSFIIQKQVHKC